MMQPLYLIAAITPSHVIGRDGKIPWKIGEDLKHFKKTTMGHAVIMGRKTADSIGGIPLPGRPNVVISRTPDSVPTGFYRASTLEGAIDQARIFDRAPFIIGGGEIYKLALPLVTRIYLSILFKDYEGDTFFPLLNEDKWTTVSDVRHEEFVFRVLERKVPE